VKRFLDLWLAIIRNLRSAGDQKTGQKQILVEYMMPKRLNTNFKN